MRVFRRWVEADRDGSDARGRTSTYYKKFGSYQHEAYIHVAPDNAFPMGTEVRIKGYSNRFGTVVGGYWHGDKWLVLVELVDKSKSSYWLCELEKQPTLRTFTIRSGACSISVEAESREEALSKLQVEEVCDD